MDNAKTAAHYTQQWGAEHDYKSFAQANPEAMKFNPNRQLPWQDLIDRIRTKSTQDDVYVYEGACGWGDIMNHLFIAPAPLHLHYLGADIQENVLKFSLPAGAKSILWDITKPLPDGGSFDFILCRSAIHHTPDPPATFDTLVTHLKLGGTIAISAYTKKTPMREAIDDAFRAKISPMSYDEAFKLCHQFTELGRNLRASGGVVRIKDDLPFLGIKAGEYDVQTFIYNHFIKCWQNDLYPDKYSDGINSDWYHPPYAYRYDRSELRKWAADNDLIVIKEASTEAQHYMECIKPLASLNTNPQQP